jgi:hypothetical protein
MKSVNINRQILLAKMSENRDKHAADYTEAVVDYKIAVRKMLQKNIDLMSDVGSSSHMAEYEDAQREINRPTAPRNFIKDYDRVIAMLKASIDDTITLDATEFSQYFQDEWHWKNDFARSTAMLKSY